MTFAVGILKNIPLCIYFIDRESLRLGKDFIVDKLIRAYTTIQQTRLASLLNVDSSTCISFDDPINRLIFDTADGEVSSEYESRLREYFDDKVTLIDENFSIRQWFDQNL